MCFYQVLLLHALVRDRHMAKLASSLWSSECLGIVGVTGTRDSAVAIALCGIYVLRIQRSSTCRGDKSDNRSRVR